MGHSQTGCNIFSGMCTNDAVTFTATSGATYYFVVDGYGGASGTYTIAMSGCTF
jgi:hypothetical protein